MLINVEDQKYCKKNNASTIEFISSSNKIRYLVRALAYGKKLQGKVHWPT